jgi:hypothetical protein
MLNKFNQKRGKGLKGQLGGFGNSVWLGRKFDQEEEKIRVSVAYHRGLVCCFRAYIPCNMEILKVKLCLKN